jgi:hypothetical protein
MMWVPSPCNVVLERVVEWRLVVGLDRDRPQPADPQRELQQPPKRARTVNPWLGPQAHDEGKALARHR